MRSFFHGSEGISFRESEIWNILWIAYKNIFTSNILAQEKLKNRKPKIFLCTFRKVSSSKYVGIIFRVHISGSELLVSRKVLRMC